MRDEDHARERLSELKTMGVRVALDDFGTGYSSLSALHRLPIDLVKIDHSFVRAIGATRPRSGLVEGIVRLAESLDLEVIAEGIEEEAQREALHRLGCQYGQGYYYARPLPLPQLVDQLRAQAPADHLGTPARSTTQSG